MVYVIIIAAVAAAYIAHRARKARNTVGGVNRPAQIAPLIIRDPALRMGTQRRRARAGRKF